jgi:hypothetical protein
MDQGTRESPNDPIMHEPGNQPKVACSSPGKMKWEQREGAVGPSGE